MKISRISDRKLNLRYQKLVIRIIIKSIKYEWELVIQIQYSNQNEPPCDPFLYICLVLPSFCNNYTNTALYLKGCQLVSLTKLLNMGSSILPPSRLSICPSIHMNIHRSVYLCIHLSVHPSTCLPVSLAHYLSID